MSSLTGDAFLVVDGFLFTDPAETLRHRAGTFLASRLWTTEDIGFSDQPEPADMVEKQPAWSMTFELGLDQIFAGSSNWCMDVEALLLFVQEIQSKLNNEFVVEVRFKSALWHSEHIAFVDGCEENITEICQRIERTVKSFKAKQ